jgi:hypothetical protein
MPPPIAISPPWVPAADASHGHEIFPAPPRRRQRSKSKSHAQPARGEILGSHIYRLDEVEATFRSNFKLGASFFISRYFFHIFPSMQAYG